MSEGHVPNNSRFVTALFLVVLIASLLMFFQLMFVYVGAIILSFVLVSLFWPIFTRIRERVKGRRRLAAGLTTALVVLVVVIPLTFVLASLSTEVIAVYEKATTSEVPFVERVLGALYGGNPLAVKIRGLLEDVGFDLSPNSLREHATRAGTFVAGFLYKQLGGLASNAFSILMHFGLMLVLMFALFADGPRIKEYLLDLSPLPDNQEEMLVVRFASISRAVFFGNGVASISQGFFGGLGFYMFGVGSGVLWGAAIAFFAFLPIVGATVVFVPAAIYLYLSGETGLAIGFLFYNMAYVAVFEYGVKPRLIGGQSHTNGVLVFLGILSGLSLFGILGLFYGPLILTMFLTIAEIYKSEYRKDLMALHSPWVCSDHTCSAVAVAVAGKADADTTVPAADEV